MSILNDMNTRAQALARQEAAQHKAGSCWPSPKGMTQRRYQLKKRAALLGYRGSEGGWIRRADGSPLCQGWDAFERSMPRTMLRMVTGNEN